MAKFKYIGEFEDDIVTYRINAVFDEGDVDMILAEKRAHNETQWREVDYDSLPFLVREKIDIEIKRRINEEREQQPR